MAEIIQDTPPIDTTPTPEPQPIAPDEQPLSEHIEQFHAAEVDPETPQEKPRHRSYKNLARKEDVPRIKELTGKIKDLEAKIAQFGQPKEEPKPEPQRFSAPPTPPSTDFPDPEPTLEKHLADGKTYEDYIRDLGRYDRKKEAFEAKQQESKTQYTQQTQQMEQAIQQRAHGYQQKLNDYIKQHPDHAAVFTSLPKVPVSPTFFETIWAMDDSPAVMYNLAQQPALLTEFVALTNALPVSEDHVALTTQWLHARLQAGNTGAAVRESTPRPPAPRPPTPVRTRPMPPVDGPPSDSGSLAEHNRYFKTAR